MERKIRFELACPIHGIVKRSKMGEPHCGECPICGKKSKWIRQ